MAGGDSSEIGETVAHRAARTAMRPNKRLTDARPPSRYVAGAGRGAVGFSTSMETPFDPSSRGRSQRGRSDARLPQGDAKPKAVAGVAPSLGWLRALEGANAHVVAAVAADLLALREVLLVERLLAARAADPQLLHAVVIARAGARLGFWGGLLEPTAAIGHDPLLWAGRAMGPCT